MLRRLVLTGLLAANTVLLVAAPALATDNGEGLLGETDDKIVTLFSFAVLGFFTLIILLGSWIQAVLERRKEARKAASLRGRTGW